MNSSLAENEEVLQDSLTMIDLNAKLSGLSEMKSSQILKELPKATEIPDWLNSKFPKGKKEGAQFSFEIEEYFNLNDSVSCALVYSNSGVDAHLNIITFNNTAEIDRAVLRYNSDIDLGSAFYSKIDYSRIDSFSFRVKEFYFHVRESDLVNGKLAPGKSIDDFDLEEIIEEYLLHISQSGEIENKG